MKKRILAILLAVIMIVSLLPVTAFATGGSWSYDADTKTFTVNCTIPEMKNVGENIPTGVELNGSYSGVVWFEAVWGKVFTDDGFEYGGKKWNNPHNLVDAVTTFEAGEEYGYVICIDYIPETMGDLADAKIVLNGKEYDVGVSIPYNEPETILYYYSYSEIFIAVDFGTLNEEGNFEGGDFEEVAPTITINEVKSDYPWDNTKGAVSVNYSLGGIDPNTDYTVKFDISADGQNVSDTNDAAKLTEGQQTVKTIDTATKFGKEVTDENATIKITLLSGEEAVATAEATFVLGPHTHKDADDNDITFQPWESDNSLPQQSDLTEISGVDTGSFYLTEDVTLDSTWGIEAVTNPIVVNLCLNGHVIKLGDDKTGSVIAVSDKVTLNLYDCGEGTTRYYSKGENGLWTLKTEGTSDYTTTGGIITGGTGTAFTAGTYGGGVLVSGGSFAMNGGTITGNATTYGGGVYVNAGTFTMSDGSITGNTADSGGGVCVYSSFTMNSGSIAGNTAGYGGGVFVDVIGSFTMKDGSITGNTARFSGGIQNYLGTLNLHADARKAIEITGNTATGAEGGVANWGTMSLSGEVIIKDNTAPDGTPQNLGISGYGSSPAAIIDGLLTGSDIRVSHMNTSDSCDTGVLTSGYTTQNSGAGLDDFFHYDGPGTFKMILNASNELEVVARTNPYWYVDENGAEQEVPAEATKHDATSGDIQWDKDWVLVTGSVTISNAVTLSDNVNLILADGAELEITGGITSDNKTLTIYGQTNGTGKLTVKGANGADSSSTGGAGGNGMDGALIVYGGDINITGGNGGNGTTEGGNGGSGVTGTVEVGGGSLSVTGGNGGNDSSGDGGGNGGIGVNSTLTVTSGSIIVKGGNGGHGSTKGGNGGDGVTGAVQVAGGSAIVSGGNKGGSTVSIYQSYDGKAFSGSTMTAKVQTSADGNTWEDWNGSPALNTFKYLNLTALPKVAQIEGDPVQQFTSLADAIAAAQDGDTIKLLENCSGAGIQVPANKFNTTGLTIDFNGKTYTCEGPAVGSTGTKNQVFQILQGNKVTMTGGTVKTAAGKGNLFRFIIQNYADLTLTNMTLDGSELAYISTGRTDTYALSVNSGTVGLNGGELKGSTVNGMKGYALDTSDDTSYSGRPTVTVTGTTLTGDVSLSGGNLDLKSGSLSGKMVEEWDGIGNGVVTKAAGFTATAPTGYGWDKNGKLIKAEAEIVGGAAYATLKEAVADAAPNKTVKLLKNVTITEQLEINKAIILDGNGKTITRTPGGTTAADKAGILVTAGATIMNLTVSGPNTTVRNGNSGWDEGEYGIKFYNAINATLNEVTVTGANAGIQVNGGKVEMTGNITVSGNEWGGIEVCNKGELDISTATLKNDGETDANPVLWNDGGSSANDKGTITFSESQPLSKKIASAVKDHYYLNGTPEAELNGQKYLTLVDAVATAKDGETVKLLRDCSSAGIFIDPNKFTGSGLTIDFDNKTYTCTGPAVGSSGTESQAFHIEQGNKVTLKNGTVTSTADSGVKMLVQNYCDLTLNGVTLDGSKLPDTGRYVLSNNCGNVVIENTTITAKTDDFALDTCKYGSYAIPSVEVKGTSVITGKVELSGGNLKLTAGTLDGSLAATAKGDGVVTKASGFTAAAPTGYGWGTVQDGYQTLKILVTITATADGFTYGDSGKTGYKNASAKVNETEVSGLAATLVATYYKETAAAGQYETTGNTTVPTNAGNYKVVLSVLDSNEAYTGSADILFTIAKADVDAPELSSAAAISYTDETIAPKSGYELSTDNTFASKITTATAIDFTKTYYVRKAEDANHNASAGTTYTPARPETPAAPTLGSKTDIKVVLTAVNGCEYSNGGTTWQDSNEFSGLTAGQEYSFYQRVKVTASSFKSASSTELSVTTKTSAANAPSDITASVTESTVTLPVSGETNTYEYSTDGTTWNNIREFTGLTAATQYTYYVRIMATDDAMPSNAAEVKVYTAAATPENVAATGTVSYTDETFTPESGYEISTKNGTDIGETFEDGKMTPDVNKKVALEPGKTYYIRKAATTTPAVPASAAIELVIPARPDAPAETGFIMTPESVENKKDGSFGGITADMEYSINGGEWISGPKTLTELSNETVKVRFKATTEAYKSSEYSYTFEASTEKLTVIMNGTEKPVAYGNKLTKPAPDPEQTGYTFGGWYKDEDCTQAWNFELDTVTDNMTLYPKWIRNSVQKAAISGNVTEGGVAVASATVELYLGTVKVAATVTDENGDYSFDNVENGIYNIVVTTVDGKTKTALVDVNSTVSFTADVELPNKAVSSVVEIESTQTDEAKSDVSKTVVGGLDEIAKNTTVSGGDKVTIKLTVEPKDESDVSSAAEIKQAAGNGKKVEFLDMSLWKQVNDETATDIGDGNTQLLTIVIPFDFTDVDVSSVMILRKHGSGNAEKLTKNPASGDEGFTVDRQAGTITIYAMKFSDYALAYEEEQDDPYIPFTPSYSITGAETENGKLTISPKNASAGSTVTITITPDKGYTLDTLTILDKDGKEVEVKDLGNGKYSFKMPSGKVTISATFTEIVDSTVCPQDETCVYAKFADADTKAWYHDGVHFCVENGYMQGVSTTAFDPSGTTTRAMIVTMLWRMEGEPVANYAMSFKDVKADQWYTEAIRWAQSTGIVEGYSADSFGPNDPITREQMATILYRYAKYHSVDVKNTNTLAGFTDVNKVSTWALDAMKWANAVGLVQGRTTTSLVPEVSITRAEAATMVQRYCEKVHED